MNTLLNLTLAIGFILALTEIQADRLIEMGEKILIWLFSSPLPAAIGIYLLLFFQSRNNRSNKAILKSTAKDTADGLRETVATRTETREALEVANGLKGTVAASLDTVATSVKAIENAKEVLLAGASKPLYVEVVNPLNHPVPTKDVTTTE